MNGVRLGRAIIVYGTVAAIAVVLFWLTGGYGPA
jgi:hypothetical protein